MNPNPQHDDWVRRVLGIPVARAPAPIPDLVTDDEGLPPRGIGALLADWQAALDQVDDQIAALQKALRATDDEELHAIADLGLNALTGNHKVRLQTALFELRRGPGPRAVADTLTHSASFIDHLQTDTKIAACDANPFGVTLSIRAALVPPLRKIQSALRQYA